MQFINNHTVKKIFFTSVILFDFIFNVNANNIQVSNLAVTGQNYAQHFCLVQFDLSWENSWRNDTTPPFNWDAAWVFIKYKSLTGEWHHATLNNTGHVPPDSVTIISSGDGKGVFIYRSYSGQGNVSWANVKIRWNYGTDNIPDDAMLDLAVYAIEMVYVPEGNFRLGDGNGTSVSLLGYRAVSPANTPALISTAYDTIKVGCCAGWDSWWSYNVGIGIDGDDGIDSTLDHVIDCPNYPTGYKAFYCMKYEVSQEQYRDFLNSLTRTQQNRRVWTDLNTKSSTDTVYVMSKTLTPDSHQGICVPDEFSFHDPIQFYCELNKVSTSPPSFDPDSIDDGQTYACNYLSWMDAAAYADWAGLRPMTEMEFEKACRGPNPSVFGEFAWGTPMIHSGGYTYNHAHHGYPDQMITNPGDSIGNAAYSSVSSGGPLRNGIFAASSNNHLKAEAGSSYYGIMELSGNVWELCVHGANNAGFTFTGLHGNGELNASGDADVDYWPGIGGNNNPFAASTTYSGTGVTGAGGAGWRGGAFNMDFTNLRVSDRSYAGVYSQAGTHWWSAGFRAVRSAPVD